ncbi:hypothetical protein AB8807_22085 (plasmid) [Xanthomonas campestris pv. olitorii]|uniref:hypothetical protein n=1 Tax=Xanthomonas TaxID=338 RepID=UPI000938516E|nr:hypothetical protein [Xanthomonas euvesicatoria]WVK06442.1 hypothetical protein KWH09_22325 [Xanthomonas campestris pv. olitorii]APO88919.1 hypothetical protein BJD11_00925 [Xanthomonas euvesicatoria]MCC8514224.1 hypothetical protein [Xanthomonas euvesicatoria pv. euvesicatoria]MCC8547970.1 hypothetical protein [Xanthomonas euvesicatoria pv. euvesicatoria]MCC8612049.1 hypothetical protein [Xanthomonas euvesicatoria pv. euvesicatoria]
MNLKVRNAAGEQHTIDACDTAIIDGAQGPTTSLLDWLTADERRELDEWCNNQTPSTNGSIAMNAWPGWHAVALRRFADTARNYRPNIQTVTQSFAQLVVGAPASGKSQMMNSFPITEPDAPNTTEGN